MQSFEDQGDEILTDRNTISGVTSILSEDPEKVKLALKMIGTNKAVTRYARTKQTDKNVVQTISSSTSMADKVKIKRAYDNADNPRQTTGIVCTLVLSNGYGKKCFYPTKAKLEDLIQCDLNDEIGYLYSKYGGGTNKNALKIIGKKMMGDVYFYRKSDDDSTVPKELSPQAFEKLFPKVVTWKANVRFD